MLCVALILRIKIHPMATDKLSSIAKFFDILRFERKEISAIYFYAILAGLVQLSVPVGIQSFMSFVQAGTISAAMILLVVFIVAGAFFSGFLQINQMKVIEKIHQQLLVRYSFLYAYTVPKLSLQEVDGYYLPELVNRFFDTITLEKSISKILLDIPTALLQVILGLILLCFYHPIFIFFGLVLILVLYLILAFTGGKGLETSLEESNYKYKMAGYLQELARGVTTFKFAGDRHYHIHKTDKIATGYVNARTAHFNILMQQYWIFIFFKVLITGAMFIVGAGLLLNQQLTIGQFIAAEIVILSIISSIEKVIVNLDKVYDVLTAVEKINKVIEKPLEQSGKVLLDASKGIKVVAKDLSFGYNPEKPIIRNLSLSIAAGEKVCIMGKHSSGKSTLMRLLCGVYPQYEGNLLINGEQVYSYDTWSFRSHTGVLLQTQLLIEGTIRENICMGNEAIATARMDALAEVVGLKQYIDSHRERYDFQIGSTGQQLSGRIISKILLMRALIAQPQLLLLEEPVLGLEDVNAQRIFDYLLHEMPGTTTIVVCNDAAFAARCNQVIVLENGK